MTQPDLDTPLLLRATHFSVEVVYSGQQYLFRGRGRILLNRS